MFLLCAKQAYAAFEAADGHPSRAALVLERAESEGCCLHERIWVTHSDLLLAQMGAKNEVHPCCASLSLPSAAGRLARWCSGNRRGGLCFAGAANCHERFLKCLALSDRRVHSPQPDPPDFLPVLLL